MNKRYRQTIAQLLERLLLKEAVTFQGLKNTEGTQEALRGHLTDVCQRLIDEGRLPVSPLPITIVPIHDSVTIELSYAFRKWLEHGTLPPG